MASGSTAARSCSATWPAAPISIQSPTSSSPSSSAARSTATVSSLLPQLEVIGVDHALPVAGLAEGDAEADGLDVDQIGLGEAGLDREVLELGPVARREIQATAVGDE